MDDKKRILIVDDERINLEFFDVMLSNLGFHVQKAENGLEALESIQKGRPDLVILDNVMPKLSGWELTRMLKTDKEYAVYSDIPIIMFSAIDDVKDKVEALELGADDYITKPFNFSEVLARIRAVLRTRELIRQIESREGRLRIAEEIAGEAMKVSSEVRAILDDLGKAPGVTKEEASRAAAKLDEWERRVETWKAEAERIKNGETALAAIKRKVREHSGP
ncbi:MAG TPA: response regulator [Magnetospirillaceae bacterium]|nr:response regulator [Magnetospirillaceae bacterium]